MHVSELLKKSKRPLLHIGNGARGATWDRGIPFVTARNANDLCASDHPLFVGRPGTFGQRGANFAVQTCDLYIAVGTRLSLTQTGYNTLDYARNAQIVQVDIDQAELDKDTLRDPIKICMDAKTFLNELKVEGNWDAWIKQCQTWKAKYPVCLPGYKDEEHINSYHFIDVLSGISDEKDIIVTDMGMAFQSTHQGWKVKKGQRLITNCGLAPMGWGLPAAVGASFATGRRVLLITGEGGLMMNIQELATVMHHKLNIKIFVFNNGGYATIKQTQELGFSGRLMGVNEESGLSFPSLGPLARSFDIWISHIFGNEKLREKIQFSLNNVGPILTQVELSPDQPQAPRSLNRRNPDGTMNPTNLEDSFPFLPPEVIAEEMK